MNTTRILLASSCAFLAACGDAAVTPASPLPPTALPGGGESALISSDALYAWNEIATDYIARDTQPGPAPVSPMMEAEVYAMVNGAMHDALNAMYPRYQRVVYAQRAPTTCTIPDVAVGTAAFTVLNGVAARFAQSNAPREYVQRRYSLAMSRFPHDSVRDVCATFGREVGNAMLASRWNDNTSFNSLAMYVSDGGPGMYRPTPPFNSDGNGKSGLADGQSWDAVTPFVLESSNQFRPEAPYGNADLALAVQSAAFVRDFNEVKRLGGAVSERTPEQTSIAYFWMENSPRTWNRVARTLALAHNLTTLDAARLFALVSLAEADVFVATFDAKYTFKFWRPITAIRLAGTTGNGATVGDPTWDVASSVVGVPTPPVPEYVSGHAAAGGAAAAVISAILPADNGFALSSTTLPDQVRVFDSVLIAAQENAESRVLIGYHFRRSTEAGLQLGLQVGRFVAENAVQLLK